MASLTYKRPNETDVTLVIGSKPLIVGRVAESNLVVHDSFVSRVHCGIGFVDNQYTLKDLGSTNGTYRNGARVFQCNLTPGDKIQVGNTALLFDIDKTSGNAILRQAQQMVAPNGPAVTAPLRPLGKPVALPVPKPTPPAAPGVQPT